MELWQPSCSVEQNHWCNLKRGHQREHSCEIIRNLFRNTFFTLEKPKKMSYMVLSKCVQNHNKHHTQELTSWFLFVMFIVILLHSHLISWDRCGT